MKSYRIVITDDEALFRKGLHRILAEVDAYTVLFEAENGKDLLAKLTGEKVLPDVILLDMQMPEMDGVDTLKALQESYPEIQVIILTSHYNSTIIVKMIALGASAFLAKNAHPDELIETIKNVVDRGFHYDGFTIKLLRERMLTGKPADNSQNEQFTKREIEILQLISDQYTNKEIAEKLFISPRTVEGHRNKMLEKTFSKNTVGLIIYAIEKGVISLNRQSLG